MALTDPTGQPQPLNPGEFVSASAPSEVTFNLKSLGPPSNLYVRPEEGLLLLYASNTPNLLTLGTNFRLLLPNGRLQVSTTSTPGINDRITHSFFTALPEGYLLNAFCAFSSSATIRRGQVFIDLLLVRGPSAALFTPVALLMSGYLSAGVFLGWPGGPQMGPVDGAGWEHSVQQANPAAGADWVYTVPQGARQRVQSIAAVLTTSATVANRNVSIIVDDGVNTVWEHDLGAAIAATTTEVVTATSTNAPTGVVTTVQSLVLPPGLVLPSGARIRTSTANIQAGDQWSAIWLLLEEWIEIP